MLAGGLLMVIASGASLFLQQWAPYVFAPGALMFAAMQMRQRYDGPNFNIRRLRRLQYKIADSRKIFIFLPDQ